MEEQAPSGHSVCGAQQALLTQTAPAAQAPSPQSRVPPQPLLMLPQTPGGQVVTGLQHAFAEHTSPAAHAERPQSAMTPQAGT
jgi:hypothetical protein